MMNQRKEATQDSDKKREAAIYLRTRIEEEPQSMIRLQLNIREQLGLSPKFVAEHLSFMEKAGDVVIEGDAVTSTLWRRRRAREAAARGTYFERPRDDEGEV
jgi:hypothetical protein